MGLGISLIRLAVMAGKEIGHQSNLSELREKFKTYPEYNIICPKCHKTFTVCLGDHEHEAASFCRCCGWDIVLGHKAQIIGGYVCKIICPKCENEILYNSYTGFIECENCASTYKRSGDLLEYKCPRCKGTGLTGWILKGKCEMCDGNKTLYLKRNDVV